MVKQTIWQSNQPSHTKLYFNEVVANALRGNIGIRVIQVRTDQGLVVKIRCPMRS